MEPVVRRATIDTVDPADLAAVAAQTFPLACPASVPPADIATFVATNLSAPRFAGYLADPHRTIFTAHDADRITGYAMLIAGEPDDPNVRRAVTARPTIELSKMYVVSIHHGTGTAAALMTAALDWAADGDARCVWLGVNRNNERAQQFYRKCGFAVEGERWFRLGDRAEHDYVMVRGL